MRLLGKEGEDLGDYDADDGDSEVGWWGKVDG